MSGHYTEECHKTFTNGASAIAQYLRVKLSAGVLAAAGLTDAGIGIATRRIEASVPGDVMLNTCEGTVPMVAAVAISSGDTVYTAASGKISNVQGAGSYELGVALEAASGDGSVIEVLAHPPRKPSASGKYTFVAADDTAGTKDIVTGLTNINSFIVQILTSAGVQTAADVVITEAAGTITIADGSSYKLTANHVARWVALG